MENVYNLRDFRNKKDGKPITESVVIKMDNTYLVKTEVPIDQSLVNAFAKKCKDENSSNVKERWSDEEIADKIANYVINSFVNIENLPSDILTGNAGKAPVQTQAQPLQTQVQSTQTQPTQDETVPPEEGTQPVAQPGVQGAQPVAQPGAQGSAGQNF